MNIDIQSLETYQLIIAGIVYMAYLCFVMFGGLRNRRVKPVKYIFMSVLMIYGVVKLFDGFYGSVAMCNLAVITTIALVKGIYLGNRKIIEEQDGIYYMHHDMGYVLRWLAFFLGKLAITGILKIVTGGEIPIWHMVYYLCLYYIIRTITIFVVNPQLRGNAQRKKS